MSLTKICFDAKKYANSLPIFPAPTIVTFFGKLKSIFDNSKKFSSSLRIKRDSTRFFANDSGFGLSRKSAKASRSKRKTLSGTLKLASTKTSSALLETILICLFLWRNLRSASLRVMTIPRYVRLNRLKMLAIDGKMRLTDVADTEQLFRLIQSIPSPKAEPFKLWLAQIASERLDEMQDPELTIDRALKDYLKLWVTVSSDWSANILSTISISSNMPSIKS